MTVFVESLSLFVCQLFFPRAKPSGKAQSACFVCEETHLPNGILKTLKASSTGNGRVIKLKRKEKRDRGSSPVKFLGNFTADVSYGIVFPSIPIRGNMFVRVRNTRTTDS